jgi:uncharacterized protein (DUF305 family)
VSHFGQNPGRRKLFVLIGATLIAVAIAAVSLFTPFLGRARFGPMRGFIMGPMSVGMMREVHAMADLKSEFDYMVRMIPHHREAVESARTLRDQTDRPEMVAFAETIIAAQTREIEQMDAWLAAWYPDRSTEVDYTPMMREYSGLSGNELDLAFLQDMIPHHMAAVMMSDQLLSQVNVEHSQLDELAARIRTVQTQEIRQMSLWMDRWIN